MEDELKLNSNFIALDGIIGRRDYFINILYLSMINSILGIIFQGYITSNVTSVADIFNLGKMFSEMPIFLKILSLGISCFTSYVLVSNVVRRLNDINGKVNKDMNILFSALMLMSAFSFYILPLWLTCISGLIALVLGLWLIFKKGAITGKYPYNITKDFNWGAFLGTWIWGLFNKSYIPLWMLLLWITPASFYFALLCGMKGNEWAYKNRTWRDIKHFKSSQETQTIVWVIIDFVLMPVILVGIFIIFFMGIIFLAASDTHAPTTHTDSAISTEVSTPKASKLENLLNGFSKLYFEKYEITENENKFYVQASDWRSYSLKDKHNIFKLASQLAVAEREKRDNTTYDRDDELNRTKIYSVETGELLGEYYLAPGACSGSLGDCMKAGLNAYKFYKPSK